MSVIWDKKNQSYKIHGHSFDKKELKTPKSKKDIEDNEMGRINSLLIEDGREVQIHLIDKTDTGMAILTRPKGMAPWKGKWWEATGTVPILTINIIKIKNDNRI